MSDKESENRVERLRRDVLNEIDMRVSQYERIEQLETKLAEQLKATQQAWNERDGEKRKRLQAEAKLAEAVEALTPSAATKAAYHGEFSFELYEGVSDAGIDQHRKVYVPWDTVKQIMAAIRARAAIAAHNSEVEAENERLKGERLYDDSNPVCAHLQMLAKDDHATDWQRRVAVAALQNLEALSAKLAEAVEALRELQRSCIDAPVGAGDGQTYVVIAPSAAILQETSATLAKLEQES
jgi:hypothetical protein